MVNFLKKLTAQEILILAASAFNLLGIGAMSLQYHIGQKASAGRHAETVREVAENRQALRDFAIKNHLIPPSTP